MIQIIDLSKNIQYIKGVGPAKAKLLNKLNINTLEDLITYFPREYEDRSKICSISEILDGSISTFKATVVSKMSEIKIRKGLTLYKLIVRDDTSNAVLTWYNQPYMKTKFQIGNTYTFHGKITKKYGKIEVNSPVFDEYTESKNTGKIVPLYPLTYNLTQNALRSIIENALSLVDNDLEEFIPQNLILKNNLCDINFAMKQIHFPNNLETYEKARYRLAFEELLLMQLELLLLKNNYVSEKKGISFSKDAKMSDIVDKLPFKLTNAQVKVLKEISEDMESEKPMNRLIQGDVGSGKTIVAIISIYKAVKSGYQAAMMAPTSILAYQHLESFNSILSKFNIKCEIITGNTTKKNKEEILNKLQLGEIDVIIGTHALIEDNVNFKKLGLVITDEQHRFGVRQRAKLSSKGNNPDVLVMTATPIPRTLALILYGDLDISIIDELPPNRKSIETYSINKGKEEMLINFTKKLIDEGRQAYIVCPLVDENEEIEAQSVTELAKRYKEEVFKGYTVEYLHGKMKPKEKDEIMLKFKNKEIDILISTTVIEVGVDVPNSNIMVIENAERFGLAQLHQLRGRVGRGEYQSYCILKFEGRGKVVQERMKIMCQTNDGFIISEKDLELRGSGDFFGTAQHGIPEMKIANLFEDMDILKIVQRLSNQIILEDPKLELEKNIRLNDLIKTRFTGKIEI